MGTSHYTKDPAGRDAALKEVFEKTVPEGLLKLETYLNGNNGKFFVGNAFTWTELHFQQFMDLVHGMTGNNQILDATPNLKDLNTRICAVPSPSGSRPGPRTPSKKSSLLICTHLSLF